MNLSAWRNRLIPAAVVLLAFAVPLALAWGFSAHRIIVRKAVETVPPTLGDFFKANMTSLLDFANEPDAVSEADSAEGPNHFFDVDAFAEAPFDGIPTTEKAFVAKYGEQALKDGRLPWAAGARYDALVKAFADRDYEAILRNAGWLAHYVSDSTMPLHATKNYKGQETGNVIFSGDRADRHVHVRYEIGMVDANRADIERRLEAAAFKTHEVTDPAAEIIENLRESYPFIKDILDADKGSPEAGGGGHAGLLQADVRETRVRDGLSDGLRRGGDGVLLGERVARGRQPRPRGGRGGPEDAAGAERKSIRKAPIADGEEQVIDLRSDTVTKPSPEMRKVMAEASVGDDVYGEDPSINALQEKSAEMMGKEAALFVPTGTMANQVALKVHTQPAEEVILSDSSHLFAAESGAAAVFAGVMLNLRRAPRGILDPADVASAVRPANVHAPRSRLVWIENTHNLGGGSVYPVERVKELSELAHERGMALHMDGARIFNAALAAGRPVTDYTRWCDSVSFCLSKGLGCPVGSVVTGTKDFIAEALRWRKMLGGGMRQAGILAAAGLYALEHNVERMREDHASARILAERLAGHPLVKLDVASVESNIVMPSFDARVDSADLIAKAREEGVLFIPRGPHAVRLVTHMDVTREQVRKAADIILAILDRC